jgi:hypothetical protein
VNLEGLLKEKQAKQWCGLPLEKTNPEYLYFKKIFKEKNYHSLNKVDPQII